MPGQVRVSLKKNILANYTSQIYVTLIGIVMTPIYVRYMGAEAYGLVGFFTMLQIWFYFLDMGLTPTMARETARFTGGALDALSLRRLLRAIEGVLIGVALLGTVVIVVGAKAIAGSWLQVQQLPLDEVQHAIMLMAGTVALRWVCGLYRGVVTGFERLVWLNAFNIAATTVRFVLVIPFLICVGAGPVLFFSYQLAVASLEAVVLVGKAYWLLPGVEAGTRLPWKWEPLRRGLKFSLSVAFTTSAWVLVTQTDKLVLSKMLTLTDYAYFTLAIVVASGVLVISAPIVTALMPRLTKLNAEGDESGLVRVYRDATQLVGVIAIPATLVLAFFAEQVLWAWTGDAEVVRHATPALRLYALGNGILSLAGFPYYLQIAKGDLKLHLIGIGLFVVLLIPTLILATLQYGVTGAGYAWLGANAIYFLAWVPKVHRRFVNGLHGAWLRDIGGIVSLSLIVATLAKLTLTWSVERIPLAGTIALLGLTLVAVAALGAPTVRSRVARIVHS